MIHFAALKAVGESMAEPLKYYKVNVSGTCNLMQVMEEFDCQKIVFSSSSCVYGDPEYLPIDECHPTGKNCANPYGRSKYISEEIMKDVSKANGVRPCFIMPAKRTFFSIEALASGNARFRFSALKWSLILTDLNETLAN